MRIEQRVEKLEATIESCRKFMLASRIAVAGSSGRVNYPMLPSMKTNADGPLAAK
jgi:hypothetical protein